MLRNETVSSSDLSRTQSAERIKRSQQTCSVIIVSGTPTGHPQTTAQLVMLCYVVSRAP